MGVCDVLNERDRGRFVDVEAGLGWSRVHLLGRDDNGQMVNMYGPGGLSKLYREVVRLLHFGEHPEGGELQFELFFALAVPKSEKLNRPDDTVMVRASPFYQSGPYYSDVAVWSGDDEQGEWYGRVVAILRGRDPDGIDVDCIFLRYYEVAGLDNYTRFPILRWSDEDVEGEGGWGVVFMEDILRPVHVVSKWESSDMFLLNLDYNV